MKKIILVRHGKAEDPVPGISDFERSLTLKGKTVSRLMASQLREIEKSMGTIVSSPAFRAIETAFIFAGEFGINWDQIIISSRLYFDMNINHLADILALTDADSEVVTLFGHNPASTEIASRLCKGGCEFVPKSGVVGITFNIDKWDGIRKNSGKMEYFLKPEKTL